MIIRLLIIGLIILFVYRLWKRTLKKFWSYREEALKERPKEHEKIAELVKDPVCNTFIEKSQAIEYKGNYFCSPECREKFIAKKEKEA